MKPGLAAQTPVGVAAGEPAAARVPTARWAPRAQAAASTSGCGLAEAMTLL